MSLIVQTAHFPGVSPETLYHAYLSSSEHSAMTADSRPALFSRHRVGEVASGQEGDELRAFGFTGPFVETIPLNFVVRESTASPREGQRLR